MRSIQSMLGLAEHFSEVMETAPELPSVAWPGGYPLTYHGFDSLTDELVWPICGQCATSVAFGEDAGLIVLSGVETYDEGPPVQCDPAYVCGGREIESSYGTPDTNDL